MYRYKFQGLKLFHFSQRLLLWFKKNPHLVKKKAPFVWGAFAQDTFVWGAFAQDTFRSAYSSGLKKSPICVVCVGVLCGARLHKTLLCGARLHKTLFRLHKTLLRLHKTLLFLHKALYRLPKKKIVFAQKALAFAQDTSFFEF